jgi:hypothetical protein
MQFLLFSGHMIDKPDRPSPRFPPSKESAAATAIRDAVREVVEKAGGQEINGIAAAACGGDILFHEACQALGIRSEIYLGIPVDAFEKTSVAFAGGGWVERYLTLVRELSVHVLFPKATADVGEEVWEQANEWMLQAALCEGGSRMTLIVLWDGEGGDGPGGTRHMVERAEQQGATVVVIDIGTLGR